MAQQYGLSFQPGDEQQQGGGGYRAPVQQAVKLLSLRLPSVVGARAIAPQALLEGGGSAAVGGPGGMTGESLVEWLRKLLKQSQAGMPPQAQSVFQPPTSAPPMAQVPTFGVPSFGRGDAPQVPSFGPSYPESPSGDGNGSPSGGFTPAPSPSGGTPPPRPPDVVTPPPSAPPPQFPTEPTPPPRVVVGVLPPADPPPSSEAPDPPLDVPDPSPFEPAYPDYQGTPYTDYHNPFDLY